MCPWVPTVQEKGSMTVFVQFFFRQLKAKTSSVTQKKTSQQKHNFFSVFTDENVLY